MQLIFAASAFLSLASIALGIVVPSTLGDGHWVGTVNNVTGEVDWTKKAELISRKNALSPIGGGSARIPSVRGISAGDASSIGKRDETGLYQSCPQCGGLRRRMGPN